MSDITPPLPLSIAARRSWDRLADKIHAEGRWNHIDADLLAIFAQTLELYDRAKVEVDKHGILVPGRTAKERVRNPALTPLGQLRGDLIRLAKAIPLANPNVKADSIEFDQFLETICANE